MENFFDHPYYVWNKRFLSLQGSWPDQSLFMRCALPFLLFAILMSILILEFIRMLDHISSDWTRFENSRDIKIIKKYAARGCNITKIYSGCMYISCAFYILMPVIPTLMDYVVPLNESRTKLYLFEAEYGVESDDYYWPIIAHSYVTSMVAVLIIISNDAMYFTVVEHACALFEIVGSNLQVLASTDVRKRVVSDEHKYKMICHCINLHRDAINFSALIESTYTASFIGVIGVCLLGLSITGVQTVLSLDQPEQALRYSSFCLTQVFHLYLNSIPGQKIMDYSLSIFEYAYTLNWPDLTPRSQKLLMLIMIRSLKRCQITAGKIYVVSMESYSGVMQTSMSYFTFLTSML